MRYFSFIVLFMVLPSCSWMEDSPGNTEDISMLKGDGVYLVNEGNYLSGNGSLSFFSYDSSRIFNNLFRHVNSRPLGDVPNYLLLSGDTLFIIVNNSGKMEIVSAVTGKSIKTVTGLNSPRRGVIYGNRIFVTSLYSNKIAVIDRKTHEVEKFINCGRSSEDIIILNGYVYFTNWSGGNKLFKIDTTTGNLADSLTVGNEPESLVSDLNSKLWILCSGGYIGTGKPELIKVDPVKMDIESRFSLPESAGYPVSLAKSPSSDSLYFIGNGIWKIPVVNTVFPSDAFVKKGTENFYRMAVSRGGDIFVTDARDYQSKGFLLRYTPAGVLSGKWETGIIPGNMVFKIKRD